ncbi:hypothetical protein QTH16_03910 [Clostridium perfringens]|uniref:hypothetical protein n=1 Tax=Clostridium perfringens TaxID=1502 RepID=UPI0024BC6648|nr:hypothetical protein [Clostridium perfringens]EGT3599994.1 hypothetical protein [Clostridium perfringens]MDK0537264.1 hypothetical protein [Clostridium perfringens]MDM0453777.1 hypothetical protein [Clostridium perfringens]
MEKYLRIVLGIIVTVLILSFAIWILPYVLIGSVILILIGWVYFKFIRKYVNKNKKEKTETYTYTFTKEEKKSEADMQDDGPVIDVDFEEVKDDK